jgi:hypothetical protein
VGAVLCMPDVLAAAEATPHTLLYLACKAGAAEPPRCARTSFGGRGSPNGRARASLLGKEGSRSWMLCPLRTSTFTSSRRLVCLIGSLWITSRLRDTAVCLRPLPTGLEEGSGESVCTCGVHSVGHPVRAASSGESTETPFRLANWLRPATQVQALSLRAAATSPGCCGHLVGRPVRTRVASL